MPFLQRLPGFLIAAGIFAPILSQEAPLVEADLKAGGEKRWPGMPFRSWIGTL